MIEKMSWIPIEKPLPAIGTLLIVTGFGDRERFEKLKKESRGFEKPYTAHELVRKERGFDVVGYLIDEKTGFPIPLTGTEGHFVGLELPPEEIVRREASLGRNMLDSISRMNHYSDLLRKVEKTLRGEKFYPDILDELNGAYGAALARIRVLRFTNPKVQQTHDSFRERTYELTKGAPLMEYTIDFDFFKQKYYLPPIGKQSSGQPVSISLSSKEKEGYLALAGAGRLAMPLLRVLIGEMDR